MTRRAIILTRRPTDTKQDITDETRRNEQWQLPGCNVTVTLLTITNRDMWRNSHTSDRGTYAEYKRRRSSDGEDLKEIKRGRLGPSELELDQGKSLDLDSSDSTIATTNDKMTEDDIGSIVLRVTQGLKKQYDDSTKRIFEGLKDIQKRVNNLEDSEVRQDTEIDQIKQHLDDYDQKEKDKNVIVTGLKNDQLNENKIIEVLNEKLQKDILKKEDIDYVVKLRNGRNDQPNRIKIAFHDKGKKTEIFKQRTKLKNSDPEIWISDDLTKRRSELAFAARNAVRDGKINMTWVYDSKVFVKKNRTDRPTVVSDIKDIPT